MKQAQVKPPQARVEVVRETFHGTTIEDPYRWMEDWKGEEAQAWFMAQAAYARELFDALPERDALLKRIEELSDAGPSLFDFRVAGNRAFYLRLDPGSNLPKLMTRKFPDADEQTLLDPGTIQGEAHTSIDWHFPSPDGTLVALGLSPGGSENSSLHVLEVASGRLIDGPVTRVRFGHVSWVDDRSFLYHRYAEQPPGSPPSEQRFDTRTFLHHLGDDPEHDRPIFGSGVHPDLNIDRKRYPIISLSPLSDWMIGVVFHAHGRKSPGGDFMLYAAPRRDLADARRIRWRRVTSWEDGVEGFLVQGDTIYLRTHKDAPRYKIVATSLPEPDLASARTIIPENESVITDMCLAGDSLLLRELDAGITHVRRVNPATGRSEAIPLPLEGTVTEWTNAPDSPDVLLVLTSWTVSPRLYRLDVGAGTLEDTGWIPPSPVDFSSVEAREVEVPSKDGVSVPLSIIHRKGLDRNGRNPTILWAYGSYGMFYLPFFRPQMLAWYERGGILAIAHVRGGGERGKEWHEAGKLLNKQRTIDDFIACAEWLIVQGYTRRECLAGQGGSAGGIPTGNALAQRPDLWAVMVMNVPMTNAFRSEFFGGGPPNIAEFGTVTTEEGFRALQIIDSYTKVRDGTPYPAVLLTTGFNDFRLEPWQAGKMAARLQAATASDRPVVLRVETKSGHGIGSTREQLDHELADILAFLLSQLEC
jgi:prolyl oligopeptidase